MSTPRVHPLDGACEAHQAAAVLAVFESREVPHLVEHLRHRAVVSQGEVWRQAVERWVGARERNDAGAPPLPREAEDEGEDGNGDIVFRNANEQAKTAVARASSASSSAPASS